MSDTTESTTENIFTRESFVAALTDYYDFLKHAYMPDDVFKYPPPGGWPELNRESLRFMGKDDIVLDTLQHMPYIKGLFGSPHEIYYGCAAVDYSSAYFKETCIDRAADGDLPDHDQWDVLTGFDEDCNFSSDAFWLADSCIGRNGYTIIVDTSRNTITLMGLQDHAEPTDLSDLDALEHGELWKEYPTWKVQDFFEHLKDLFRNRDLLPDTWTDEGLHLTDMTHEACWSEKVKILLQEQGWLSEDYDKNVCIPKLLRLIHDMDSGSIAQE